MSANVHFAHNPALNGTRSVLRPLSARETMNRAKAVAARTVTGQSPACSGQIFIGMFFDGTGNNRDNDYVAVENTPPKHKHSNVVRLFHAYPDYEARGTTRYYRFYVPGVGTPFREIGDSGGVSGTAASWNGEPRLIWGITRVFNAVSDFVSDEDLIPEAQSGQIANAVGGIGSMAMHRNYVFGTTWSERLKSVVAARSKNRPYPEQINVSVFGFSRGAAEARAFVNWLYDICENDGGQLKLAGIPLRVDFLGIFDTVASVGIAGGFSSGLLGMEGRQSWASDNMQIHPKVESCLHIVAAHEVRATFPLDSVRIDGRYPPNVKEYVYPGAHSDVGGGYSSTAQGKTDALARIAGFEMYCAALAAGVPFSTFAQLKPDIRAALIPTRGAVAAFDTYMKCANVSPGPVEDMMRAHMGNYFTYRYQARRAPYGHARGGEYYTRAFFKKSTRDRVNLRDTQQHFLAILAGVVETIDHMIDNHSRIDSYFEHPYQNTQPKHRFIPANPYALILADRIHAIHDLNKSDYDRVVDGLKSKVERWTNWLSDNNYPFLRDADSPERDVLSVVQSINETLQDDSVVSFFDEWVHDSMAGLAFDGVNEFLLNGIGLFKFRRVYCGNRGDAMLKEKLASENAGLSTISKQKRQQRRQQDVAAAQYNRAKP